MGVSEKDFNKLVTQCKTCEKDCPAREVISPYAEKVGFEIFRQQLANNQLPDNVQDAYRELSLQSTDQFSNLLGSIFS